MVNSHESGVHIAMHNDNNEEQSFAQFKSHVLNSSTLDLINLCADRELEILRIQQQLEHPYNPHNRDWCRKAHSAVLYKQHEVAYIKSILEYRKSASQKFMLIAQQLLDDDTYAVIQQRTQELA